MSDSTAELFDRIADGYDEDVPFYATLGRLLVSWAEPAADARVLDIGAGRGAITRALVEARGSAGQIVAGDISPKMVEQLAALQLPGVQARLLDANALDLPDGSFDAVFAGFVLSAIADPAPAIGELTRVLRPSGELVVSAPGPCPADDWWERYGEIVDEFTIRLTGGRLSGTEAAPASAESSSEASVEAPSEPEHNHHEGAAELLARVGLRLVDHTVAEIDLPIDGPEAYWQWLQMHGNRWLYDALSEPDSAEFRRQVLESLHNRHPAEGKRLIAGAIFERYVRL
jgi:ubiquinone/menaquinone biosynthesis C-methylase UbiE